MNCGAVILAGGRSRRMGRDKAELEFNGIRFLDKLACELSGFPELLISVNEKEKYPEMRYPLVCDIYKDCGPMGGLHAALMRCESDALVVVPCDVPFFSREMADEMCACMEGETDAVIAVTEDGREHPLCGVYKKSCLGVLEQCLEEGNYRMRDALAGLKVKTWQAGNYSWRFLNVNTPEEFEKLQGRNCLAVCGWKDAGKTTLIEKLIPELARYGLNVATVKHDGHSYVPDVPGTDSHRFFQAGASTSILYDGEKYSLTRRGSVADEELFGLTPEADIILFEGAKWSGYPKIEVVRRESGGAPIPDLRGRIAYVSDMELSQEIPVFGPEDISEIAAFIVKAFVDGTLRERWKGEKNDDGSKSLPGTCGP